MLLHPGRLPHFQRQPTDDALTSGHRVGGSRSSGHVIRSGENTGLRTLRVGNVTSMGSIAFLVTFIGLLCGLMGVIRVDLTRVISRAFGAFTVRAELSGSFESRFKPPPAPVLRRQPRRRRRAARCLAGRLDRSMRLMSRTGARRAAARLAAHRRPVGHGGQTLAPLYGSASWAAGR